MALKQLAPKEGVEIYNPESRLLHYWDQQRREMSLGVRDRLETVDGFRTETTGVFSPLCSLPEGFGSHLMSLRLCSCFQKRSGWECGRYLPPTACLGTGGGCVWWEGRDENGRREAGEQEKDTT